MRSNDPRDDAILFLVTAIHLINMNPKSREVAARAEEIIRGARLEEQLVLQRDALAASAQRLKQVIEASKSFSRHPPAPMSVSAFGSSDGVHGWTGVDADGNRVTWKVEPSIPPGTPAVGEQGHENAASTAVSFEALAQKVTAAAEKRFAQDPFAPTFEVLPGEDAIHIKLYPRAGSVQYLINATGPCSAAFKVEGARPKLVQVSLVAEREF